MSRDMSTSASTMTAGVDAPVPLTRLVQVEMRKMLDTRAGFWLLLVIVLLTMLTTGLTAWFGRGSAGGAPMDLLLLAAGGPQGFLLPVLGVLLVTSEWGQRAAMNTFVLVPRRERIVVAKVAAAVLVGLAVLGVTFAVAALAAVLSGSDLGEVQASLFGHFTLLQIMGILQGLAFGALLLNSAAAIVAFFLVPVVSNVIVNVVPSLREAAPWVDLGTAQAPLSEATSLTSTDWSQLATASAIWIVLPLVLGTWRMLTAEVK